MQQQSRATATDKMHFEYRKRILHVLSFNCFSIELRLSIPLCPILSALIFGFMHLQYSHNLNTILQHFTYVLLALAHYCAASQTKNAFDWKCLQCMHKDIMHRLHTYIWICINIWKCLSSFKFVYMHENILGKCLKSLGISSHFHLCIFKIHWN